MVRSRPTLPTKSMARASAMIRGKRSGIVIDSEHVSSDKTTGMDDMDAMFDAAQVQDAEQEEQAEAEVEQPQTPDDQRKPAPSKKKKKKQVKTPKSVRLSLPGARNNDDDDDDNEQEEGEATAYVSKLRDATKVQNVSWSPSEISHVSTAPPTPSSHQTIPSPQQQPEEEFLTQEEDDDDEDEEQVLQAAEPEPVSAEKPHLMESPEASFPVADNDDPDDNNEEEANDDEEEEEADDDDLGPPALPDDDDDDNNQDDLEAEEEPIADPEPHQEPEGEEEEEEALAQKPAARAVTENPLTDTQSDGDNDDNDDNDDNEDDEEDGAGYNMVHDPETPKSVRERRAKKEKTEIQKHKKQKAARRKSTTGDDDSEDNDDDDDDDEQDRTPPRGGTKSKKRKKRATNTVFSPQGVPTANRDYETVSLSELVEDSPQDKTLRRSGRARCKPLLFWKNERPEYGAHDETGILGEAMGDMPVVKSIVKALPTPYRKKRKPTNTNNGGRTNKQKRTAAASADSVESEEPFDTTRLRTKYKVVDGETAHIWDDGADDSADLKVVSYAANMEASDLPIAASRTKPEGKAVGKAAQAFNIPNDDNDNYVGYIMGNLLLPPKGIKDAESVGPCSQTFTVCYCQPRALEVAYGDPDLPEGSLDPESAQRFYLSPGDLFRVPPGNCYRLQNHSSTNDCLLTWTIIRPRHLPTTPSS